VTIDREQFTAVIYWTVTPDSAVDIYTRTQTFTIEASSWTKEFDVAAGTDNMTDPGIIANGITKYYKVVSDGVTLTNAMLVSDVVGKYDINLVSGWNLISLPIIPATSEVNALIGDMLTAGPFSARSDNIYGNFNGTSYEQAWLRQVNPTTVEWQTISGQRSAMQILPDRGYWVNASTSESQVLSIVGRVPEQNRSLTIKPGWNLLASSYPVAVPISSAGLVSSGANSGALSAISDSVYTNFNGASFERAWLRTVDQNTKTWTDMSGVNSTLNLRPVNAIWYFNVGESPITWSYPKPY
jgi:hypothetical protein